ncbi:hypothetical protein B0T26DRAFT_803428 [Lasiosphaeria miniovina]|uniref:Uncharacterized protein n=1 Tax=Lasiosphaeria miniovina TaxID=1954250 RepID=A0AA40AMM8_9PEZI|nr:uncharacterized protein B0T26DRAFT_803428 [Lasiosphaeria miniovina]KAK0718646.1 hypothetical protein B0T26DRAFT_803428 [Lasiosphaeria miniovina]
MSLVAHLVRRGVGLAWSAHAESQRLKRDAAAADAHTGKHASMSTGQLVATALLIITVVASIFTYFWIEYTLHFVLGNLVAVEDSTATAGSPSGIAGARESESKDGEFKDGVSKDGVSKDGEPVEVEGTDDQAEKESLIPSTSDERVVPRGNAGTTPITASIRSTLKHIRALDGFKGYFRGLGAFFLYAITSGILYALLVLLAEFVNPGVTNSLGTLSLPELVADFTVTMSTCRLHCNWTHATVRDNTDIPARGVYRRSRYVSRKDYRFLSLPAMRIWLARAAATALPLAVFRTAQPMIRPTPVAATLVTVLFVVVCVLVSVSVVLPARIARTRIETSLLLETVSTIVPVDRTFGGRVDRTQSLAWWRFVALHLGLVGAYKTFDRATFCRALKVWAVYFFVALTFMFGVTALLCVELLFVMGGPEAATAVVKQMIADNGSP